ncbi:Inactive Phospholipase C-Like Protein 2 [Manis pentadactyla]|nr:Inactive Phospholipase C-Like Protein 2 [Manis pentadactyla]
MRLFKAGAAHITCDKTPDNGREAFARSDLEVGSLEVTRATGAGGVSNKRCWVGLRGLAALGVGSRDAQHGRGDTPAAHQPSSPPAAFCALPSHSGWSPQDSTCLLRLSWFSCPQQWWRTGLHRLTTFPSGFRGQHPSNWDWWP